MLWELLSHPTVALALLGLALFALFRAFVDRDGRLPGPWGLPIGSNSLFSFS